ncbi:MAG: hypothetical protein ACREC6_08580 [Hyphomicrobiaceae bacterium]
MDIAVLLRSHGGRCLPVVSVDAKAIEKKTFFAKRKSALPLVALVEAPARARDARWLLLDSHDPDEKHRAQWRSTLRTYAYPIIGVLLGIDVDGEQSLTVH